jgi:hypothetical protein
VRRALAALAGAALLAQAVAVVPALIDEVGKALRSRAAELAPESLPDTWQPDRLAARDLPPLLGDVPADARVLLVAGVSSPCFFDAYTLPRPLRVLQDVDEALLARAERERGLAHVVAMWRRHLDRHEMRLTPARLARELPRHDVLLAFLHDDEAGLQSAAAAAGVVLRRRATAGVATLFEVQRP